ncbi:hypothetical protein LOTGIDRAFT_158091 [Lottia gigantea]|uniref:Uncharacterized protein n=1 Tax=Lottia gigantea TaxID=225164 RepID=V4B119_LOTGI|nr:hypothetical protein LOTGIDRAFT_158091 [Lottia gigantea]ESO99931.1 hypothetical protein LOTGIDRAFT_158091 [Lottia gigantea]
MLQTYIVTLQYSSMMFRWIKKKCIKKSQCKHNHPLQDSIACSGLSSSLNQTPENTGLLEEHYYCLGDQDYHIYTEIPETAICHRLSRDRVENSPLTPNDSILSEFLSKSSVESDNISLCSVCRVTEAHLCDCTTSDLNLTLEMENLWSEYAETIFQSTPNSKSCRKSSTPDGYEIASRFVISKLDMSRRPLPPIPGTDDTTSGDDSSGFYEPMYSGSSLTPERS